MDIILNRHPALIDVFRGPGKTTLRVADQASPGRLWLSIVFENDDQARAFLTTSLEQLNKERPKE